MSEAASPIKILSLVEATTVNAVAKNLMEFHHVARELSEQSPDFPKIEACLVTFERKRDPNHASNAFVNAARDLKLEVEIIPERRRFDLSAISALRRVIELQKPDLVVTHSVKSHFLLWRSQLIVGRCQMPIGWSQFATLSLENSRAAACRLRKFPCGITQFDRDRRL